MFAGNSIAVVDADGHMLDSWPALACYIRAEKMTFNESTPITSIVMLPPGIIVWPGDRVRMGFRRQAWWGLPGRSSRRLALEAEENQWGLSSEGGSRS